MAEPLTSIAWVYGLEGRIDPILDEGGVNVYTQVLFCLCVCLRFNGLLSQIRG